MAIRPKGSRYEFTLHPDPESVRLARAGLKETGGYCPCKVLHIDANRCICQNTRDTGGCECGLYVGSLRQDGPSTRPMGEAGAEGFDVLGNMP